jgi:hypothetical protein
VISERTKAGMAAARRRSRHVGRPAKLALDQIDYARRMIVAGKGRAQIARCRSLDAAAAVDEGLGSRLPHLPYFDLVGMLHRLRHIVIEKHFSGSPLEN